MPDGINLRSMARSAVGIAREEMDAATARLAGSMKNEATGLPDIVALAEVAGQTFTRFSAEPIRSLSDALIKLEVAVDKSQTLSLSLIDPLFAEVITFIRSQVDG